MLAGNAKSSAMSQDQTRVNDKYNIGPCWNAYVATGKTVEQRRKRLEEVPEEFRASVEDHVRTVFLMRRTR